MRRYQEGGGQRPEGASWQEGMDWVGDGLSVVIGDECVLGEGGGGGSEEVLGENQAK